MTLAAKPRMPTIYVPHGGGPWPWIAEQADSYAELRAYLQKLPKRLAQTPSAILIISAHWEAAQATITASPAPSMLYDYSGFPPQTYEVKWPAPGSPDLARKTQALLQDAGIACELDMSRGFDHGTFVPLSQSYPKAEIPTVQLSLVTGLDPAAHLDMGRALAPLRDQGVLIIGSGMSYHNMRGFFQANQGQAGPERESRAFDQWLAATVKMPEDARYARLLAWNEAPCAKQCHPRKEHLMPLHVVVGAGLADAAKLPYRGTIMSAHVSAVQFG